MKTIVITGPSGSGKTILSHKLNKIFDESIVIKTDSYYRDNLFIKFLSIFIYDIYDRIISIKRKEILKLIASINNNEKFIKFYDYNFKRKLSTNSKREIQYKKNIKFLILEGIFSHRIDLNYNNTINIICEEQKEICYQRRLKRDKEERGRNIKEVNKKFSKSWKIYYKHLPKYINSNKVTILNPVNKTSFEKLIKRLKEIA